MSSHSSMYLHPGAICLAGILIAAGAFAQTPAIPTVGAVKPLIYSSPNGSNDGPGQVLVAEKILRFQKASFLQVEFSKIQLGEGSVLEMESLFDDQKQIWEWNKVSEIGMQSYYFNGDTIRIRLFAGPNTKNNSFAIKSVAVGNPVDQLPPLTICGSADNRVRSSDRRVARLLIRKGSSVGVCTGWLISRVNCFATAGHCLSGTVSLVTAQFNVPLSTITGAIQNPSVSSQYNWEGTARRSFENGGVGKDWGVFTTLKNSATGRYAGSVQGSYFLFSSPPSNGTTLRVTGHGADSTPKTYNFVQQTSFGPQKVRGSSFLGYRVDTMGGNSGSPVMLSTTGRAVAVHTHGGCSTSSSSYNKGTRQDYAPFVSARTRLFTRAPRPDLRPVFVSGPSLLIAGTNVTLSSRIYNYGTATSGSTTSGYYISTNSIISTADRLIFSFTTNALAVGSSHFHSASVRLPRDLQNATCYLGVYADRVHRIVEQNETNNGLGVQRICHGLPDLSPTALTPSTTTLSPSQLFSIRSTIKNIGRVTSAANTSGYYFSTDSIITTGDTLLGSFSTNQLAVNASHTVSQTVRAPRILPNGFCYLGVYADRFSKVTEISDLNNSRSLRVLCRPPARKPDLTPTAFTSSTTNWAANNLVTVRSTTKNIGTANAVASNNGYYLSDDNVITVSDILLGTFTLPSLAVNASASNSRVVRIPSNVRQGVYHLGVLNDRTASISELNELNNARAVRGNCFGLPDLTITALTSSNPYAGGDIFVKSTTKNIGTASAPSTLTGIVLSTNSTISTADDFLGGFATGPLSVGAFKTVTTRHCVPYCPQTGRYYVGAIADIARRVIEGNESNNTRAVAISLTGFSYTGAYIQWVPRYGTMAQSVSSATLSARLGGKGRMCITVPRLRGYFYFCSWSLSSYPPQFDVLSSFSRSLINTPIFFRWVGKLDNNGQGFPSFNAPPMSIPNGFTAYTHVTFYTTSPPFLGGLSSNSIRTVINR